MSKQYQELFEPATLAPEAVLSRKERKKYFGKIVVTETATKNAVYYSVALNDDLFADERLKTHASNEVRDVLQTFFDRYGIERGDKVLVAQIINAGEGVEKRECSCTVGGNVN